MDHRVACRDGLHQLRLDVLRKVLLEVDPRVDVGDATLKMGAQAGGRAGRSENVMRVPVGCMCRGAYRGHRVAHRQRDDDVDGRVLGLPICGRARLVLLCYTHTPGGPDCVSAVQRWRCAHGTAHPTHLQERAAVAEQDVAEVCAVQFLGEHADQLARRPPPCLKVCAKTPTAIRHKADENTRATARSRGVPEPSRSLRMYSMGLSVYVSRSVSAVRPHRSPGGHQ